MRKILKWLNEQIVIAKETAESRKIFHNSYGQGLSDGNLEALEKVKQYIEGM